MMLAAEASGALADGKGVVCLECGGKCTIKTEDGEKNCTACDLGRVRPDAIGWIERIPNLEDLQDTLRMIFQSRERPLLPHEWLALPAQYVVAYRLLIPYIAGEFEDRAAELKKGSING